MTNPTSRGQQRDKPFRDALRLEIAEAGDNFRELRVIARALINEGKTGNVVAIKEIGDRLDGRPAQAIIGGDADDPAVRIHQTVEQIIVEPKG